MNDNQEQLKARGERIFLQLPDSDAFVFRWRGTILTTGFRRLGLFKILTTES
jgi:hypothetical protein